MPPAADPFTPAFCTAVLEQHRCTQGQLLPVLHQLQERFGYIAAAFEAPLARAFNLSRAEVHGVITFYSHFRQTPPGAHVVRVCCAEACQANGGEAVAARARERSTTAAVTIEPVYCLGLCANGPALLVDEDELHAGVTPAFVDDLLDRLGAA